MNYIEQEKEKIIKEVLNRNKLKPGQLIDYKKFLELYQDYKNEMSEFEFAEILDINYMRHNHIKNTKGRTRILKCLDKRITKKERERIIKELLDNRKIRAGQLIDYLEFLKLYGVYEDKISEQEFAAILGVSSESYMSLRRNKGKVGILKSKQEEINKVIKEQILKELLDGEKIQEGEVLDYTIFLELYGPYTNRISEQEFAEILGINYSSYKWVKNAEGKVRILIKREEEIIDKEKIIEEVLDENNITAGESINYIAFLKLYESYKEEMSEIEFAKILGISYSSYFAIKTKNNRKARILKYRKNDLEEERVISNEEKEKIVNEVFGENKLKSGKAIDYSIFLQFYDVYKEKISEQEFAEILGISYVSYSALKNTGNNVRVQDYREKEKITRIKYILEKEARYYSLEEIESLSKKYDVDVETIIKFVCGASTDITKSELISILKEKGQIWIGQARCSKNFAETYSKIILEKVEQLSRRVCSRYSCKHMQQDIASDAIIYLLQKCGDIDKNFKDNKKVAEKFIIARVYMFIKYRCFNELRAPEAGSLYKKYTYKGDSKEVNIFDVGIKDERENVQDEVEEKVLKDIKEKQKNNQEEACIELLMQYIENGLNREEAIARTGEMLKINPETMLELLKTYMIKQNRVRQTKDGGFVLGE